MLLSKINIAEEFSLFDEWWPPKILAKPNGQLAKIAKEEGKPVWESHDNEDNSCIVFKGALKLNFRLEGDVHESDVQEAVELQTGELFVVSMKAQHGPRAENKTNIMIIEPKETQDTGEHQTQNAVSINMKGWI